MKINKLLFVGLSSILLFSCGNEQSSSLNLENYLKFGEKYLSRGMVIDAINNTQIPTEDFYSFSAKDYYVFNKDKTGTRTYLNYSFNDTLSIREYTLNFKWDILSTNKLVCYYDFNDLVIGENNTEDEEYEEIINANMFEISRDVIILTASVSSTLYFSISYLNSQNLGITFE